MVAMGLTVVFPTTDDSIDHLTVDIVILHGLNGNATKTWTNLGTKAFWPRDFLPKDVPGSRVFTFEYDASAAFGNTTADIADHARDLLSSLVDDREQDNEKQRPIIFIAHSLGGIVLKQALLIAEVEAQYSLIFEHTIGLIFFGTPHRGSDKATYGRLLSSIATTALNNPPSKLLSALKTNSDALQRLTSDFKHQIPQYKIISFYETKPTGPFKSLIVEKYSALLEVPGEDQIPVAANHRDMCKFESRNDEAYVKLWKRIRRIVESNKDQHNYVTNDLQNKFYLVPYNVSASFTGREEICDQLKESCLPSREFKKQHRFVLHGLGGSGKTQVALKFAEDHRERFWGIFWVDCTSTQTIQESFMKIARTCRITGEVDLIKTWLANSQEPWLLILDNADNPSLDILSYLPAGSRGVILITTRNPDFKTLETVGSYEFAGMGEEEAITLLLRVSGLNSVSREGLKDLARPIVTILGCLALAIIQAGATIRQRHCSIEEYGEMYKNRRRDLLSRAHSSASTDYKYTVYTTWEISIGMIEQMNDGISSKALDLLCCFSFMHNSSISEEIFKQAYINLKGASWSYWTMSHQVTWLVEGVSTWDPTPFRDSLNRLFSFSLISINESNSVSMHPLVHAWAKDRMVEKDQALWSAITASTLAMSIRKTEQDEDVRFMRSVLAHFHSCLPSAKDIFFTEGEGVGDRLDMAEKFAFALKESSLLQESMMLRERIFETRKRIFGADDPDTLKAMDFLAQSYYYQGLLQTAFKVILEAIDRREKVLGPDHVDTLSSRSHLSTGYLALGRYQEALTIELETLQKEKRFLGEEHAVTLASTENLAGCYLKLGRPKEALVIAEKLLKVRERTCGEDHPSIFLAKNLLAICYVELGRFHEACALGEELVKILKRTRGEDIQETLVAMGNLAYYYCEVGRYQDALTLGEETLSGTTRALGSQNSDRLTAMLNVSMYHYRLGQFEQALQIGEEACDIAKKSLGENHPTTLLALSNLGMFYRVSGRLEEAEKIHKEVLEKRKEILGENNEETVTSMFQIASDYMDQGRFEEALKLDEKVLDCRLKSLGEEHPNTLAVKHNLTIIHNELGDLDSIAQAKQLLEIRIRVLGKDHPVTIQCKDLLTACYKRHGRLKEAVENQEQVVEAFSRVLGKENPITLKSIELLTSCRDLLLKSSSMDSVSQSGSMHDEEEDDEKRHLATGKLSDQSVEGKEQAKATLALRQTEGKSKDRWDLKSLLKKR